MIYIKITIMDQYFAILILSLTFGIANGRKIVDMSHMYNDNKTVIYPLYRDIKVTINQRGWTQLGSVKAWLEYNEFSMPEHLGTHMDAPSHFGNAPGYWRLHQIPPERFIGDAVVIDISHKADLVNNPDAMCEVSDIMMWEEKYGQIKDGSIVIINSGWDKYWGDELRFLGNDQKDASKYHFPGMGAEAAQWLVDNRKISGLGTDTISIDTGNSQSFPAHITLLSENIFALENIKNAGKLPPAGARIYVFPMKLYDGSGAPTRIIAEFDEKMPKHPKPGYNSAVYMSTSLGSLIGLLFYMLL